MTAVDTVLWADPAQDLAIRLTLAPTPEVIGLLERTVWGSRNLRYRIHGVAEKLARLTNPFVFMAEQHGQLAAVCIVNRKIVQLLGKPFDTVHFVMIAAEDAQKGRGLANLLSLHIRHYIEQQFEAPVVAYAYIESTTDYSLRISDRVGYAVEALMPLTVFSRFWPKDDRRVRPMADGEAENMIAWLHQLYDGHSFLDFESSLNSKSYFVLRHQGRIAAGAQAELLHWSVEDMPGWSGTFLVKMLPHLPVLRGMLPVQDLYFLRFGNLLVTPGHESKLIELLEALLARHGVRVGLIMIDRRSPVLQRILAFGRLGTLRWAVNGGIKMVADFKGVSADDIARIAAQPIVMSPRDII